MATYTPNYNLEKPDASDDFGDFRASYNSNMDIIDQNLGGGGGGHTIIDPDGTAMPNRSKLKFTGSVSVTDDSVNNATVVNVSGNELYLDNGLIGSDSGVYVTCNLDKTLVNGFYLVRVFDSSNSAVGWYHMKWEGVSQVLSISDTVSQGRLEITSTTAGLTYYSGAWRNIYCDILSLGGSGGGSGDTVSWTQIQATGEKIAEITINGTTTDVLIPFEAKIIVTTTTGLTVTATKGGTTYTATETSTGVYEVTVDSKGTWTVTDGTNTTTVSVTAQTTYNVAFVVIPDGSTVTPTDDIQTWLNCANIWDKAYTTLAEVLADTTTLSALISSNNAVDYLVRSTTWIGNTATVPVMTDNTHPSGVVSASTTYSDANAPYKAFDGSTSTFHSWVANQTGNYLRYDFERSVTIARYSFVMNRYNADSAGTKNIAIQISDDGLTWTNIDTFSVAGSTGDFTRNQDVSGINTFRYIQIYTNDIMRPTGNAWNMSTKEFQIYSLGLTNSSTAMTYIGLNNYCANKLLNDATWRTAICQSTYKENVLNVKNPIMTDNTHPSGVASASSIYTGYYPYYAFDGNSSSLWHGTAIPAWVMYEFPTPVRIVCCLFNPQYNNGNQYVKDYKIQGSNDNVTWTDLYSETLPNSAVDKTFSFANSTAYKYYRMYATSTYSGNAAVKTLQFYGREDV